MKMNKNYFWDIVCALTLFSSTFVALDAQEITVGTLLEEMADITAVTRFPDYKAGLVSSHDRRSVSPLEEGWFANDDFSGYERYEENSGRRERVLADIRGAGAVTRFWLTALDKRGTLRFYFDGDSEPGWTIDAYDMMCSGLNLPAELLFPHTSYREPLPEIGGSSCYFPITFAKGIKITLEECADGKNYYQIEYRLYPAGTSVRTFTPSDVNTYLREVDYVAESVRCSRCDSPFFSEEGVIPPGESLAVAFPKGGNCVRSLRFRVGDIRDEVARRIVVRAVFDNHETVWAPLPDFASAGYGSPAFSCRYAMSDGNGRYELAYPMPYRRSATLEIVNLSEESVSVSVDGAVDKYRWTDSSLYFHASWLSRRRTSVCGNPHVPSNAECHDETLFSAIGRGVFVGNLFTLYNYADSWYGEGDAKIWVDDDAFPSLFGTGLEDYYNASWAPLVCYSTPYGGALRADTASSKGYNTFLRTRVLDRIPFSGSLHFDLEFMGWTAGIVDWCATSFWYGDSTSEALLRSDKTDVRRPMMPAVYDEKH